ncbi:hypothetical protein [Limnobaculum xujianqingii]|uniref:hypothetical protein n=1 Tax=Limnobaculum xujianqingii TaxID=2738837 RepID=UPI001125F982|nr:hypothetical protein [Limnobaculum xujianqingii]
METATKRSLVHFYSLQKIEDFAGIILRLYAGSGIYSSREDYFLLLYDIAVGQYLIVIDIKAMNSFTINI